MPWFKELKYPGLGDFDFSVPGVSSMSCDSHKYGFGPKVPLSNGISSTQS